MARLATWLHRRQRDAERRTGQRATRRQGNARAGELMVKDDPKYREHVGEIWRILDREIT